MKDRLLLYLDMLRTSFWLIPVTLMLLASLLALASVWLDSQLFPQAGFGAKGWLEPASTDGIRSILTTTAASILGVAGVSFSITIASLTLASQQFGPRLIRTFLQSRFTQTVLGFFVATFLYCMLGVHVTSVVSSDSYVPLSLLITVVSLTFVDLILLVLFIHHISVSIQVNSVISEVANDMRQRADSMFDELISEDDGRPREKDRERLLKNAEKKGKTVNAAFDGYIQVIDYSELVELCSKNSLELVLETRAGDYVLSRQAIGTVVGNVDDWQVLEKEINAAIVAGKLRNPQQDLEFSIRQLVEIGLRALSPGINDPFTAMTCMDSLGSLINHVMYRQLPESVLYDSSGIAHMVVKVSTFKGLVEASFNQLRQNACANVDVLIHTLSLLLQLVERSDRKEIALPLYTQGRWIMDGARDSQFIQADQEMISQHFSALESCYKRKYNA